VSIMLCHGIFNYKYQVVFTMLNLSIIRKETTDYRIMVRITLIYQS